MNNGATTARQFGTCPKKLQLFCIEGEP